MAVEKGRQWGEPAVLPPGIQEVHSDAAAGQIVSSAMASDTAPPALYLCGGDLMASLGGRATAGGQAARFLVDVVEARTDAGTDWFIAHLVARRSWWTGRIVAVMNADLLGTWRPAPRAHPGDGLVDVVDADLPLRQRLQARSRLAAGDHLPHPGIHVSRRSEFELEFPTSTSVWLDGRRAGRTSSLAVRVIAEALTVYV